jgi:integrase
MARKRQIRYWPSRGTWTDENGEVRKGGFFTTMHGRQECLATGPDDAPAGPTFGAALKRFRELMQMGNAYTARDRNTLAVVLEKYLVYITTVLDPPAAPATFRIRKTHFQQLIAHKCGDKKLGDVEIRDLTIPLVNDYIAAQKQGRRVQQRIGKQTVTRTYKWGRTSVCMFIESLQAALNWAASPEGGLIDRNPIPTLGNRKNRPKPRSRSRQCEITEEEHRSIVADVSTAFGQYCEALWATGARPGEMAAATKAAWRDDLPGFFFAKEETQLDGEPGHKRDGDGKDRAVIFPSGAVLETVKRLVAACQSSGEHVFKPAAKYLGADKKARGRWTGKEIIARFAEVRDRLGLRKEITAYSYRHSFINRMLRAGMPVADVAALVGTSIVMIQQNYSHLAANYTHLRDTAERFAKAANGQTPPAPA